MIMIKMAKHIIIILESLHGFKMPLKTWLHLRPKVAKMHSDFKSDSPKSTV